MTTGQPTSGARMSRRRFITIAAALSGASTLPRFALGREPQTYTWQGVALGAQASLTLQHPREAEAKVAIAACLAEVARLETILSLHRTDSALVRLNRDGHLDQAPADLRVLLGQALVLAERSAGAFDPTIQPLWTLYSEHFHKPDADPGGPAAEQIAAARRVVDWRKVEITGVRIRLREPGMAITLNGIAQGYITDKIGDLLKDRGFAHVLVNMGEQLAIGPKWNGERWSVGIADPRAPASVIESVTLERGAVATSGGYACRFDNAGRFTHILDPHTGTPARLVAAVTIVADRATLADGLSTTMAVAPVSRWPSLRLADSRAYVVPLGAETGRWLR